MVSYAWDSASGDCGSTYRLRDRHDDHDRNQPDSGVQLHLSRSIRYGTEDLDYVSECGDSASDLPGADTGVQDALLEHWRRGTGTDRRSGVGGLHDLPGRQASECGGDSSDGRHKYRGWCAVGSDSGVLQGKMEHK